MINTVINILLVVGILGILIFVHELGHFLAARLSGVRVDEFAIGLGPKFFSFKRGETLYRLNILPIGGYVKILGEGDEIVGKKEASDPRNLKNKSKWVQIFVMLAGIIMNLLLSASVYFFFISSNDYKWPLDPSLSDMNPVFGDREIKKVSEVEYVGLVEDMNAMKVGLPEKGVIKSVNGKNLEFSYEFTDFLSENKGKVVGVEVCNDECEIYDVQVSDGGTIGIYMGYNYEVYISYQDTGILSGFAHAANVVSLIGDKLSDMFSDAKRTGDYSEITSSVSGPVGIYVIVDHFKEYGWVVILGLLADFSLTLAFMNALPIPALDGGRVFLILIELVMGRPLNKKVEAIAINLSFILLLLLMVAIVFKDIFYIDQLRSLLP